jgi:NADH-quinone oxidoreductase subunit N
MDAQTLINDIALIRAEIFLAVSTLLLLVYGVCLKTRAIQQTAIFAVTILFVTGIVVMQQDNTGSAVNIFGDMLTLDRFGVFMKVLILLGGIGAILMGVRDLAGHVIGRFEYNILILLATLGMLIMVSANNMLMLYMGLELQSLSLYILAAFNRNSLQSSEAGLKYFILGALSSGLLLFGISLVYGYTGSTSYALIAQNLTGMGTAPMAMIVGMVFILTGLAFKISAVPFHMWTPDVYEGAPASVTAFFATAPKVAALALLIRLLIEPFGTLDTDWSQIIYAMSLLSMVVGAFAGLVQKNIYRLLAYSSIGHMGYIMLGLLSGTEHGLTASLVYIGIYMVMTAGTFALILSVRSKNIALREMSDFSGLSVQSPKTAYGLTIFLFSMSGIPPLAGFFGKLVVFQAALANDYKILAIVGVLTSVVAAYYYLIIIKTMFFDKSSNMKDRDVVSSPLLNMVAYPALAFTTLYIIFPNWLVSEASRAAQSLIN